MSVGQTEFTSAIFDATRPVPEGLTDPEGRPAGRRFSVYRNNVAVSLTEALETAFPVIRKLVGEEFFKAMAGVYLRAHPPSSPLMMYYGQEMPEFLANFQPAQSLPYLPDVARLELAMRRSYHAADPRAFDPARLQDMPADVLMAARIELAETVELLSSPFPIHAIWAHNMTGAPAPVAAAEAVVVLRAGYDPVPHLISNEQFAFLSTIRAGNTLEHALEAVADDFDLGATLGLLLSTQSISNIIEG